MQTKIGYFSNGKMMNRINYINGVFHGLQESWYENGQLCDRENYIRVARLEGTYGRKHGLQEGWYENGLQRYSGIYKYGIEITKEEYEKYLNSISRGLLNILCIGKNTLDLIITRYLVS